MAEPNQRNMENTTSIGPIPLEMIMEKSENFPIKFPIDSVRCQKLQDHFTKSILEANANSAYPLIHEKVLPLIEAFLNHKSKFGTNSERAVFTNMTAIAFVERLLQKRPVMFMLESDKYILRDGTRGAGNWETIGQDNESPPLILQDYLSYDEIKLSAFLSVSSHTVYLNDGNRNNRGIFDTDRRRIESDGIIIGLIGARLSEGERMEHREVVKSRSQNTHHNGYGTFFVPTLQGIFCNFYQESSDTFEALKSTYETDKVNYVQLEQDTFFSIQTYKKRMALSLETLFIEANHRAKLRNTTAYVHVVGLGLGVWKIYPGQNKLFLDTSVDSLMALGAHLSNVSDVCFAHMRQSQAKGFKNGDRIPIEGHPLGGITVHLEDREPHQKLTGIHEGKLLVVSYAWDGNALPGNEFWTGSLSGSGDPAAACSTQVAELHNSHINPLVSGTNVKIATLNRGIVSIQEYYGSKA